jgi:hypothetical protein
MSLLKSRVILTSRMIDYWATNKKAEKNIAWFPQEEFKEVPFDKLTFTDKSKRTDDKQKKDYVKKIHENQKNVFT